MKNIDIIVGARPNFIKAFPVYEALNALDTFNLRLINTGQHYDDNMADIFFRQMKMKKPDINLMIGSGTHALQTGKIMVEIERVFIDNTPDLVIVFGDVNSTIAAALSASKLHIHVAHIEAGLRSFDRTMPEEINRVLTDQISDLLFITSPEAKDNLIKEGKKEDQIYFVGNTMIDSLIKFKLFFDRDIFLRDNNLYKKDYILITIHRPSNVDDINRLKMLIESLNLIGESYNIVWPIHPRTRQKLNDNNIQLSDNIYISDPLGYLDFMTLQKNAKFIITDSGGVQEESTYFGVPCFTIRDNTERPITISQGSNILVGTNFIELPNIVLDNRNVSNNKAQMPDYWDGKASERIAKVIDEYLKLN